MNDVERTQFKLALLELLLKYPSNHKDISALTKSLMNDLNVRGDE